MRRAAPRRSAASPRDVLPPGMRDAKNRGELVASVRQDSAQRDARARKARADDSRDAPLLRSLLNGGVLEGDSDGRA